MASWERLVEVGSELGPDPELDGVGDDELTDLVRSQASRVTRETARWIVIVAEFVVRGSWARQGARNPGEWLSYTVGLAPTTARDHVRVGLALRRLPKIREAFLAGQVSYSKVRAITRLGHEQTEEVLLEWADAAPAAELESIIKWTRRSCRVDGVEADPFADDPTDQRSAAARVERADWIPRDDGSVEVRLRMDEADAGRLRARLDWLQEREDQDLPRSARVVLGLLGALEGAVDGQGDVSGEDRDRLVVAVDLTAAGAAMGRDSAESRRPALVPRRSTGGRPTMGVRTLQRLACTAGLRLVAVGAAGSPLDVGRAQRRATAKQRRALALRDPLCRFPGCTSARHLHVHHALEWDVDDGPTDMDNLIHLCGFHHRFLHRAGWSIRPEGAGRFTFLDASGNIFRRQLEVVSDDSAELSPPTFEAAVDDGRCLQPRHWFGDPVDLNLCVQVLRRHLDRRRSLEPDRSLALAA